MARVAVVHNTLDFRGGADAVCLATCRALAEAHEVTLLTCSTTAPADLAATFDIDVHPTVDQPPGGRLLARGLAAMTPVTGPQLAARSAILRQYVAATADAYDIAVSTANEFALPLPSVQYIHHPQFHRSAATADDDAGRANALWSRLAGPTPGAVPATTTLLANSAWTADVVAEIYDERPAVVHPPVDPIPDRRAWEAREQGAVAVGRLAPDKRVLDVVRIVDGVRERGHDLHLHLVGTAPPAYRRYVRRVERAVAERPYVTLERDVGRDRLETLLATHRYGINAKPAEHFGMAVAEYVAAGMVAFAPDSGGQREILQGRPDRLFDTTDEAAALVATAIEDDARPSQSVERFGRERFDEAMRTQVSATLDRAAGGD
jgi:glycosyltransferase involved in cell wall biosynthesis